MKLKYYLRGLGIGIVVTALLMGIATKDRTAMTDEEIKARAKELGMIEQELTLADIKENIKPTEQPEATALPVMTEAPEATKLPTVTQTPESSQQPETTAQPESTQEAAKTPEPTDEPEVTVQPEGTSEPEHTATPDNTEELPPTPPTAEISGDSVCVTIYEGNNSVNVSKVLAEAGLIEDSGSFDKYLRKNGYSKIINTGVYHIAIGTAEEEIARIITNTD